MKGAEGLRLAGLASTEVAVKLRLVTACTASSASVELAMSNLSRRLPPKVVRRASKT